MKSGRRGNGEGSIYFLKAQKRWFGVISVGLGRRRTVSAVNRAEVVKKLRALQADFSAGTLPEPNQVTVAAWIDDWIRDFVDRRLRSTTAMVYKLHLGYVKPHIGHLKLTALTPLHIQRLYSELQCGEKALSAYTVARVHARLVTALNKALEMRLIRENPARAAKPPKSKRRPISPLSREQTIAFLEATKGHRLEALFTLALSTGMRQGELFALEWCDVDFENARVSVRGTLVEIKGKFSIHEPKTERSRRQIDIPVTAIEALRRHQKAAEKFGKAGYVFRDTDGGPLRKSNFLRRDFKPALRKAQLPETIHFHDLRHTHATLLLESGINVKVTQERLGHARITTTLDTYSHVTPTMQKEAARAIDAIMKQPTPRGRSRRRPGAGRRQGTAPKHPGT